MRRNQSSPLISVVVPVYNGQDYLKNCINSILAQTYRPLEIIIVNDGSADRTGEICRELEKAHEAVSILTLGDRGVSAGRNAGLECARGEYVTFVDADDRIHPKMLEVLYQNLTRTGSDVSGCSFFSWQTESEWERGAGKTAGELSQGVRVFTQKQFALEGILKNDTRCWSKLYKKECIQNVRFREGLTIGEDMLFLVDLLPNVRKCVTAEFQGYGYFQNPHGAINRSFKPSYMDQIECWKLAGEALSEWTEGLLTSQETDFVEETIAARQMIGIMLTVGKLSELPKEERCANEEYVKRCHQRLKECRRAEKGMKGLDFGYRAKVRLFAAAPKAYVRLYGGLKRLKR